MLGPLIFLFVYLNYVTTLTFGIKYCCQSLLVISFCLYYNKIKWKYIQIKNKKVKLSLFADDMILYTENTKDSTKKYRNNKQI